MAGLVALKATWVAVTLTLVSTVFVGIAPGVLADDPNDINTPCLPPPVGCDNPAYECVEEHMPEIPCNAQEILGECLGDFVICGVDPRPECAKETPLTDCLEDDPLERWPANCVAVPPDTSDCIPGGEDWPLYCQFPDEPRVQCLTEPCLNHEPNCDPVPCATPNPADCVPVVPDIRLLDGEINRRFGTEGPNIVAVLGTVRITGLGGEHEVLGIGTDSPCESWNALEPFVHCVQIDQTPTELTRPEEDAPVICVREATLWIDRDHDGEAEDTQNVPIIVEQAPCPG